MLSYVWATLRGLAELVSITLFIATLLGAAALLN